MKNTVLFVCVVLLFVGCRPKPDVVMDATLLHQGGEYWESLSINGRPAGFQHTTLKNEEIEGRPVRHFERHTHLVVLRYGQRIDLSMKIESQSEAGAFQSCRVEIDGGGETTETKCRVQDGKLLVEDTSEESEVKNPWTEGISGPEALTCSLLAEPMKTGQYRYFSYFEPALQRRVNTTLRAERIEKVEFEGTERKLLRIRMENLVDGAEVGQSQIETLWTDAAGNILRRECPMGDGQTLLAVRTDQEKATAAIEAESAEGPVEIGNLGIVPLNRRIPDVESARKIEFFVQMSQGKPSDRFPVTPFQNVEALPDGKTAKITVWSAVDAKGETVGNDAFKERTSEAKPGDLGSSRLIDLRDPNLAKLVATVDTAKFSPWQTASAMERLAHDTIQKADFSLAFASSSEVLQSRTGDCTEYAVLLAALCRAQKIPCRVTLGLVYTPLTPVDSDAAEAGMAFHLWNEVLVDGVWRPLDATTARGGADAARIKIADADLADDSPTALTGSVLDVLGRLRINVAE